MAHFVAIKLTQRQRLRIANVLHIIATWFYLLFIFAMIVLWTEVWKGIELLNYISNAWFTFAGAREMFGYGVISLVAGRAVDVYAKKLNPRLANNPERGYHFPDS